MNQNYDDHEERKGMIVEDKVLDYILYDKITKNDRKRKDVKGGCLTMVLLLFLPAASLMLLCWTC